MFATTKEIFVYVRIYVQPSSVPESPSPPRSVNSSSMNSPDSSSTPPPPSTALNATTQKPSLSLSTQELPKREQQ